jgi:two-component system sensor histidine kinase DesK
MPRLRAQAGWFSTSRLPLGPAAEGDPQPPDHSVPDTADSPIPGGVPLARMITMAVVCGFVTVEAIELLTTSFPDRSEALGAGLPSLALLIVLVFFVTSPSTEQWPIWKRLVLLLAIGLVTYLPYIALGTVWEGQTNFFAGSALLLLTGWMAWTVYAATIGTLLVANLLIPSMTPYDTSYETLLVLLFGLVLFGLARMSLLIRYVNARRGELAQLAVITERMRFARDLHDLLGYSLSAITLKAEFTRRLIGTNPGRARDELAEVLDIARQALADVRIVASGYRNISLAKEASSVTALLAAAGIDAQVDINCGMLEEKVDTVLATVLREAVTNMLRHSTARHCAIEASITDDTIHLHVANDGVPRTATRDAHRGGLDNLATRMASIGGRITTGIRTTDGWFTVHAQAPLTPPRAEPERPGSIRHDPSQPEGV